MTISTPGGLGWPTCSSSSSTFISSDDSSSTTAAASSVDLQYHHHHHDHQEEQELQELQEQPTSSSQSPPSSSSPGNKTAGKRFVRRAKRWAELQQRRAASVNDYETVLQQQQLQQQGEELQLQLQPSLLHHHSQLAASRSLPFSMTSSSSQLLQLAQHAQQQQQRPHHHRCWTTYQLGEPEQVRQTEGVNEYGMRTVIKMVRTPPSLTVYHPQSPPSPAASALIQVQDPAHQLATLERQLSSLGSDAASSPLSSLSEANSLDSSIDNDDVFTSQGGNLQHEVEMPQRPLIKQKKGEPRGYFDYPPKELTQAYFVNTVPPPDRTWMMIRHADPERPIATFTVLCYNVLCDKYATQSLYSYCPSWALNWEYRKQSIIKEIRNYEADIITLQEVETEQYKMLFKPEMAALGYSSIFQAKSRAKTMNEEDRKYVDGCAIFWKNDKFELSREQLIEFTRVAINKCHANQNMLNRVMPKDNIALCAVLKIKDAVYNNRSVMRTPMPSQDNVVGSPLIVCTAHIHWDPEYCDVKLVQSMMLVHELWKLVEEVSEAHRIQPHQCPTLICGDLNSLPDSGVFEFLSKSGISRSHPDLKNFKEDAVLERFSHTHDGANYTHALRLDSAVESGVVPFTNYTLEFKGMIDYIFSTPQSLARLGVLGPFDMEWTRAHKIIGFPHPHVPSDHIPIMAQYAMIPTNHQRPQPAIQHFGNQHSGSFGAVGR